MSTDELPFKWSSIALPAFLPALLFSTGEGAIIPIIPTVAHSMGATLAIAGLIASMIMVGEVFGDIPSGWLVARVGERKAMIGGALVAVIGLAIATFAPNPFILGVGILLVGLATAVFALARHAFMTSFVPQRFRARALSTLGGTFRAGYFVGPFIAAGVIAITGNTSAVFWVDIVGCFSAAIVLLVLPLWAVSIGVSDSNTALIIGIAGAIDFGLFYTSGAIMDRWGRLASALPSMVGLGIAHLLLAVSFGLTGRFVWFVTIAMFMSLANGVGSGILMTLGADLADKRNPAPFLGAWRFTGDAGSAAAPLLVALLTGVATIAIASGVMGVLGLVGAGLLLRYVPRYAPRPAKPIALRD
jgi:MFS family permease